MSVILTFLMLWQVLCLLTLFVSVGFVVASYIKDGNNRVKISLCLFGMMLVLFIMWYFFIIRLVG